MRWLALAISLVALLEEVQAQEMATVEPGMWVRIGVLSEFSPSYRLYYQERRGRVVSLKADTLVIKSEGKDLSLAIPFKSVSWIEARYTTRNRGKQVGLGAKTGGVSGFLLGVIGTAEEEEGSDYFDPNELDLYFFIGTTVVGMASGAMAGAIISPEEEDIWKRVSLGAFWGAIPPFVVTQAIAEDNDEKVRAGVFAAFFGGCIGGLTGAVTRSESWRQVLLPTHVGWWPGKGGYVVATFAVE